MWGGSGWCPSPGNRAVARPGKPGKAMRCPEALGSGQASETLSQETHAGWLQCRAPRKPWSQVSHATLHPTSLPIQDLPEDMREHLKYFGATETDQPRALDNVLFCPVCSSSGHVPGPDSVSPKAMAADRCVSGWFHLHGVLRRIQLALISTNLINFN